MTDVMIDRKYIEFAVEFMSEDLGCDHAVNICNCETQLVVMNLKLALDGKKVCPTCAGDGFVWDQATANAQLARFAVEHKTTLSAAEELIGGDAGFRKCFTCGSSGVVDNNKE